MTREEKRAAALRLRTWCYWSLANPGDKQEISNQRVVDTLAVAMDYLTQLDDLERLQTEIAVLREAIWSVPDERPDGGADMPLEATRRQAVDQARAFERLGELLEVNARLREKLAAYGEIIAVPQPDGPDRPAEPEDIRAYIAELQGEWEAAEKEKADLDAENALLVAELTDNLEDLRRAFASESISPHDAGLLSLCIRRGEWILERRAGKERTGNECLG